MFKKFPKREIFLPLGFWGTGLSEVSESFLYFSCDFRASVFLGEYLGLPIYDELSSSLISSSYCIMFLPIDFLRMACLDKARVLLCLRSCSNGCFNSFSRAICSSKREVACGLWSLEGLGSLSIVSILLSIKSGIYLPFSMSESFSWFLKTAVPRCMGSSCYT